MMLIKPLAPYHQPRQRSQRKSLSCVRLFATPWTVAYQAPPSVGFSRQEYWSGLPFPSPGDLPDPGIEPGSLPHCRQMLQQATREARRPQSAPQFFRTTYSQLIQNKVISLDNSLHEMVTNINFIKS